MWDTRALIVGKVMLDIAATVPADHIILQSFGTEMCHFLSKAIITALFNRYDHFHDQTYHVSDPKPYQASWNS